MLGESAPESQSALYLKNTNGVHYDVVIDVCSGEADISDLSHKIKLNSESKSYTEGQSVLKIPTPFSFM